MPAARIEDFRAADPCFGVHGEDVVVGRLRRDRVRRGQDVAAAVRGHALDQPRSGAAHLVSRARGQHALRVHPAHECQSITELPLEFQRIHPRTVTLDRVEHIQADLDQVADDRAQCAAAVIGHGQAPLLADGEDARQLRLDLLAPGARAHHHTLLRRHVIARPQPVQGHPIARRFGQLNREISAAPEHLAGQVRIGGHIRQRIRHAAQPPVHLEDARRDVAADEMVGRIHQHRGHQVEQRRLAFDREMIVQHLIPRAPARGKCSIWLKPCR